jgi:Uma2 family endonuclease
MSTSIIEPVATRPGPPAAGIPPLESGDRLTLSEFERRYAAMPRQKKAELVEGVVYLPSPVRHDVHGNPHADLLGWLVQYRAHTTGISVGDNSTVRLDLDNEFQPDALLMIERARGGQARVGDDGYVEGAPELVAEVAATSASIDLNAKLHVYRRTKIREYIVWRTFDQAIDWFVLQESDFVRLQPDAGGLLRSAVFPGLWLDPAALLSSDMVTVLKRLHDGIATPEHAAFVAKLQATAGSAG